MDELINTTEAAQRLGITEDWIRKLCAAGRIPGAKKIGRDWVIPPGAKIEPTGLGRPLRTLEIPGSKHKPAPAHAGGAGPREGKGKGRDR